MGNFFIMSIFNILIEHEKILRFFVKWTGKKMDTKIKMDKKIGHKENWTQKKWTQKKTIGIFCVDFPKKTGPFQL